MHFAGARLWPAPQLRKAERWTLMRSTQKLIAITSLWLAGLGLRLTVLAIPPVITLIKDDLQLSATEVGMLTGLPVSLFAFAAVLGSLLAARAGASRALLIGLIVTAAASALRSASGEVGLLYSATILMSLGVAIMQPALPPLVCTWLPDHIAFGTAVYTNGLLIGEILPVAITPLLLPLIDTSWRISLLVWSLPVLVIAAWIASTFRRRYSARHGGPTGETAWSGGSVSCSAASRACTSRRMGFFPFISTASAEAI